MPLIELGFAAPAWIDDDVSEAAAQSPPEVATATKSRMSLWASPWLWTRWGATSTESPMTDSLRDIAGLARQGYVPALRYLAELRLFGVGRAGLLRRNFEALGFDVNTSTVSDAALLRCGLFHDSVAAMSATAAELEIAATTTTTSSSLPQRWAVSFVDVGDAISALALAACLSHVELRTLAQHAAVLDSPAIRKGEEAIPSASLALVSLLQRGVEADPHAGDANAEADAESGIDRGAGVVPGMRPNDPLLVRWARDGAVGPTPEGTSGGVLGASVADELVVDAYDDLIDAYEGALTTLALLHLSHVRGGVSGLDGETVIFPSDAAAFSILDVLAGRDNEVAALAMSHAWHAAAVSLNTTAALLEWRAGATGGASAADAAAADHAASRAVRTLATVACEQSVQVMLPVASEAAFDGAGGDARSGYDDEDAVVPLWEAHEDAGVNTGLREDALNIEYLREAAAAGDPEAAMDYADVLRGGYAPAGVQPDPEEAERLLRDAAVAGHPEAQARYGLLLVDRLTSAAARQGIAGGGGPDDDAPDKDRDDDEEEEGDHDNDSGLGAVAGDANIAAQGEPEAAQPQATTGHGLDFGAGGIGGAQLLGGAHHAAAAAAAGREIPGAAVVDPQQAARVDAVVGVDGTTMGTGGGVFGDRVPPSPTPRGTPKGMTPLGKEARHYLEAASNAGIPDAWIGLGFAAQTGNPAMGIARNLRRARRYFLQAADAGLPQAHAALGAMYLSAPQRTANQDSNRGRAASGGASDGGGDDAPVHFNTTLARHHLELAVPSGAIDALYNLGIMDWEGWASSGAAGGSARNCPGALRHWSAVAMRGAWAATSPFSLEAGFDAYRHASGGGGSAAVPIRDAVSSVFVAATGLLSSLWARLHSVSRTTTTSQAVAPPPPAALQSEAEAAFESALLHFLCLARLGLRSAADNAAFLLKDLGVGARLLDGQSVERAVRRAGGATAPRMTDGMSGSSAVRRLTARIAADIARGAMTSNSAVMLLLNRLAMGDAHEPAAQALSAAPRRAIAAFLWSGSDGRGSSEHYLRSIVQPSSLLREREQRWTGEALQRVLRAVAASRGGASISALSHSVSEQQLKPDVEAHIDSHGDVSVQSETEGGGDGHDHANTATSGAAALTAPTQTLNLEGGEAEVQPQAYSRMQLAAAAAFLLYEEAALLNDGPPHAITSVGDCYAQAWSGVPVCNSPEVATASLYAAADTSEVDARVDADATDDIRRDAATMPVLPAGVDAEFLWWNETSRRAGSAELREAAVATLRVRLAVEWYTRAADVASSHALFALATAYTTGQFPDNARNHVGAATAAEMLGARGIDGEPAAASRVRNLLAHFGLWRRENISPLPVLPTRLSVAWRLLDRALAVDGLADWPVAIGRSRILMTWLLHGSSGDGPVSWAGLRALIRLFCDCALLPSNSSGITLRRDWLGTASPSTQPIAGSQQSQRGAYSTAAATQQDEIERRNDDYNYGDTLPPLSRLASSTSISGSRSAADPGGLGGDSVGADHVDGTMDPASAVARLLDGGGVDSLSSPQRWMCAVLARATAATLSTALVFAVISGLLLCAVLLRGVRRDNEA